MPCSQYSLQVMTVQKLVAHSNITVPFMDHCKSLAFVVLFSNFPSNVHKSTVGAVGNITMLLRNVHSQLKQYKHYKNRFRLARVATKY